MDIPVFVSCPTDLSPVQNKSLLIIRRYLKRYKLEDRALGRSDYPTELPLREVLVLARHCSGGLILGFEQFRSLQGVNKPGTKAERDWTTPRPFPTPWNHLEAGILFGLGLPLLIFRQENLEGGIFDAGVTDVFTHTMPIKDSAGLDEVFLKWQAEVRRHYYA